MKHIMLVSNSFGSLYNFRYELIETLMETYRVTLVCPMDDADRAHFAPWGERGCGLVETKYDRRGKNPLKDLALLRNFRQMFRMQKPDLVMTYTVKPNVYAGLAAGKLGIPYLANVTGLGSAFENDGLLRKLTAALYKKGLKKCELVFFQNEDSRRIMTEEKILTGKSRLVAGSGINLDKFSLSEYPQEESYLYMARIMKEKGAEEFFDAAARLKQKYPEVLFEVVGFCEEAYEEKIKVLQEQGVIRYYGWRDDPETFIRKTCCLINPSYHEGMSNVCLEAAATGRPMLVSDIPGCRETVTDGVSGFLFPPADAESLYQRMEQFHQLSVRERKEMGLQGRKKMEETFDRKKVVGEYCAEIRRMIGE